MWVISRVCEEFDCLPDQAREALENDTNGSIFQILELRALANAKSRIDDAGKGDVPTDRVAQRYLQLHLGLVGDEMGISTDKESES